MNCMTAIRTQTVDRLRVQIYSDRAGLGAAAGRDVASEIRELQRKQGNVRIIFAAAPSQNEMLATLVKEKGIDWSRVTAFHMDEYIGLGPNAPQRFGHYLRTHIFDLVRPGVVH